MGRNTTPDGKAICKTHMKDNEDVDTVNTRFGLRKPTPEQRMETLEKEVEELKRNLGMNTID